MTDSLRDLLMKIRYDLTAAQGKLTEAVRQVDELHLDEPLVRVRLNQQAPYKPGELRYLEQARRLWARLDGPERSSVVRVYLEGFTGDAAEIGAHLDALETEAT